MIMSLLYPLRPTPLLLILCASILIWAAMKDIFILLVLLNNIIFPLLFITAAKYLFLVLERTAQGEMDPPYFSHTLMQVFKEWRPYQFLMVVLFVYTLSRWLWRQELELAANAVIVFSLVAMPAYVGLLGLHNGMARSLNPLTLMRFMWRLGPAYLGILGVLYAGYALVVWFYESGPGIYVAVLFNLYSLMLVFHWLGRLIYTRRAVLDYRPDKSPERDAEAQEGVLVQQRKKQMDRIFQRRRQEIVLPILLACIEEEADKLGAHAWYHAQLMQWDHQGLALRHAPFYIRALREAGDTVLAGRIERECRAIYPDFSLE